MTPDIIITTRITVMSGKGRIFETKRHIEGKLLEQVWSRNAVEAVIRELVSAGLAQAFVDAYLPEPAAETPDMGTAA